VYLDDIQYLGKVDVGFFNLKDHRSVLAELSCEDYRHFLDTAASSGFGVIFNQEGVVVMQRGSGESGSDDLVDGLMETCEGAGFP